MSNKIALDNLDSSTNDLCINNWYRRIIFLDWISKNIEIQKEYLYKWKK